MRIAPVLASACLAVPAWAEDAPTPEAHIGFPLAETIAQFGCVLHEEATNMVLFEAGLTADDFPPMAIALMQDGILRPTGNGTLTLVNWGPCTGAEAAALLGAGEAAAQD
ncbi:hypothetical protein KUV65_13475 [Maritalea mobilis]|uniref:Uncharacterized protein n=1 Tax=[Roseibacterium] beibuensis TaxID=1193142 RepID=A0ABP9L9W4_9RHOB|nr:MULTISPECIES: hypothetical protein [Alphaproteobacteria]MBY6202383.1 hypothetical protein [Maritalea mobilis]MCS6624004.1 hypothetical protein [Roseibacterium beibuensis]